MLDNHVMDQVGPERNLGDKVEQLCVHEEENQIVFDSQEGGGYEHRYSHDEEELRDGQVQGMDGLRPFVVQLQSPDNGHNENQNRKPKQLNSILQYPVVFEFFLNNGEESFCFFLMFFLIHEFHIEKPQEKAVKVRWASGPWLNVDIREIAVPFGKVSPMSNSDVLIDLNLYEIVNQGQQHQDMDDNEGSLSIAAIQIKDWDGQDEDLHVILQIPAPAHTHPLPIIHNIIDKNNGLPHGIAIVNLPRSLQLVPNRPRTCMHHDSIIDEHCHNIRWPESQKPVHNSQRIFHDRFHRISEEGVGDEEASDIEEYVDCVEGCQDEQEERSLHLIGDGEDIDHILDANGVHVSENDPHHAQRFDPIEDIKFMLFVFEDVHGFFQAEGSDCMHFLRQLREGSRDDDAESEYGQQDHCYVECGAVLRAEVLRGLDVLADDRQRHVFENKIRNTFDLLRIAASWQAQAHRDSNRSQRSLVNDLQQPIFQLLIALTLLEEPHLGQRLAGVHDDQGLIEIQLLFARERLGVLGWVAGY